LASEKKNFLEKTKEKKEKKKERKNPRKLIVLYSEQY
jgi:hypothetical protein